MHRAIAFVAVVALLASSLVAPVAAQATTQAPIESEAPYYDDENGSTNMTDWVPNDGNATADGMLELLARIPGLFIGTGDMDPSGSGYEGFLILGIVIGAATLFSMAGTNVGPIAGSMVGLVVVYVLTMEKVVGGLAIAPPWVRPLLLFALVGIPVATALIRVFRG